MIFIFLFVYLTYNFRHIYIFNIYISVQKYYWVIYVHMPFLSKMAYRAKPQITNLLMETASQS